MASITVKDLNMTLGNRKILSDASLNVEQGELLCIWGPSGGGKSTFLRILAGLEKADSGTVLINGHEVDMDNPKGTDPARKDLGFVFQNSALISNLNVFDNVALPLRYHQMGSASEIEDKTNKILTNMLVGEHFHAFPHELSLGLQKRVAIARTMVLNPRILLMDEPTAGLDYINRINLLALLSNVSQLAKVTLLMVTHDLEIPKELGTKISILHDQKLSLPCGFSELKSLESDFLADITDELELFERGKD